MSVASCCFGPAILCVAAHETLFRDTEGNVAELLALAFICSCVCQTETAVNLPLRSVCLDAKKKSIKATKMDI